MPSSFLLSSFRHACLTSRSCLRSSLGTSSLHTGGIVRQEQKQEGANDKKQDPRDQVKKLLSSLNRDLTVRKDLGEVGASAHRPALALGAAGLIPFAYPPLSMFSSGAYCPALAHAQLAYAASILSFLGGVRWGFLACPGSDIQDSWQNYCWAVAPSLVAWSALLLTAPSAGVLLSAAGLGVAGYMDLVQKSYPAWFRGLRFVLTSVAVSCLTLTLFARLLLSERKEEAVREEKPAVEEEGGVIN